MNKIWFTSDLHFGHKNIVKYTNRGVETTEEKHDQWLIEMWNDTVHASDIVYHLGDFSFYKSSSTTLNLLAKLKGNKVLLKGNHDHSDNFKLYAEVARTHEYLEKKFEINARKQHVCMFHFPISSFHKQSHGAWHLHGHCHGNHTDNKGKMLDVGLDNAFNLYGKHCFFDLEMINNYMKDKEIYVADSHRENL